MAISSGKPAQLPTSPNAVTIFGGGIAGLTAAHELVERGFQVQVWERQADERSPERGCDVGGLARTQWGHVPWPLEQNVVELSGLIKGTAEDHVHSRNEEPTRFAAIKSEPLDRSYHRFYVRWAPPKFVTLEGLDAALAVKAWLQSGGVSEVDIRVQSYGLYRLSSAERKRRVEAVLQNTPELKTATVVKTPSIPPPQADQTARPDSTSPAVVYSYEVKTTIEQGSNATTVTMHILLEDSLDPDSASIEITPHTATTGVVPLLLKTQWQAGKLDSPLDLSSEQDGTARALELLKESLERANNDDVWYVEAIAPLRNMSFPEFLRRANAVYDKFNPVGGTWLTKPKGDPVTGVSLVAKLSGGRQVRLVVAPLAAPPYPDYDEPPEDIEVVIGLRPRVRWLPGEHGYRFFPSFYHHLFDTMKRVPLLDVQTKTDIAQAQERSAGIRFPEGRQYVETGRTLFDNIDPTTSHVLASSRRQRSSQFSRMPVTSLEELRSYLLLAFGGKESGGFDLSQRDLTRVTLKLLQFATACENRRAKYEEQSWWDFLGVESYSKSAQNLFGNWPKALVAMSARECDARTQWVPLIQLLLDQVRLDSYRDGTLRGPTSEAFINPWRRYLEAQGVQFVHGELVGFEKDDDGRVWPQVDCFDPRYPSVPRADRMQPELRPGYFIVALPTDRISDIARKFQTVSGCFKHDSDMGRATTLGSSPGELEKPLPRGELRHYSGIQFYFAEDVYWVDGHVYYPDSPWQLTSISQARFWQDRMDWEHGYRGILSVIVGSWDVTVPGKGGKCAWETPPEELAREVWRQLKERLTALRTLDQGGTLSGGRFVRRTPSGDIPEPIYWHLDQNLTWNEDKGHYENSAPFFIAQPGRFQDRPGNLDVEKGYQVQNHYVLAGHHMKTYTRLPSMEAANESGRHAVNAILKHLIDHGAPSSAFHGSYCDVWNPEDREVDDLQFFKDLDDKLNDRGLPHAFEIFDIDFILKNLLRGGSKDPLDPLQILSRLRGLYRQKEPA